MKIKPQISQQDLFCENWIISFVDEDSASNQKQTYHLHVTYSFFFPFLCSYEFQGNGYARRFCHHCLGDNYCWQEFISLNLESFQTQGILLKGRICSLREQLFSFKNTPWPFEEKGGKCFSVQVIILEGVSIPLKIKSYINWKKMFVHEYLTLNQYQPGPSCSKLTMSLVNDSLKFTSSDTQICWNFLLKKCE